MRTARLTFLTAAISLALAGCAAMAPTKAQLTTADYGVAPTNAPEDVRAYFAIALKDPRSAQYQTITPPMKGFFTVHAAPFVPPTFEYGWLVDATVNAKNSYGGYIGFQTWEFLLRGDRVVDVIPPQP